MSSKGSNTKLFYLLYVAVDHHIQQLPAQTQCVHLVVISAGWEAQQLSAERWISWRIHRAVKPVQRHTAPD
jgi:hypothetical protein